MPRFISTMLWSMPKVCMLRRSGRGRIPIGFFMPRVMVETTWVLSTGRLIRRASLENTRDVEAAQFSCSRWAQFNPILFAAFGVDAQDANTILRTELFDAQNRVCGIAVKLGAGSFAENRFGSTGTNLFGDGFEQGKTGG